MDNTTYVALSRATALRRSLDITANNIANAGSTGFKTERPIFEAYVERQPRADVADSVSFVVDGGSFVDLSQGALERTGGPLDLALEGPGWFGYETPDGRIALGRNGQFTLNADGALVTHSGARVLDAGGGTIAIPAQSAAIEVARDGTISTADGTVLGTIGVFAGRDIQTYDRLGGGLFAAPGGLPPDLEPVLAPHVLQGMLERSNVQPVVEITRLIEAHRAFERSVQVMKSENDRLGQTLQRIGRSS